MNAPHTASVCEHHAIMVALPPGWVLDPIACDDIKAEIWQEITAWCETEGLSIDAVDAVIVDRPDAIGVRWSVTLGRGDEHPAGPWIWSGRAQHWLNVLTKAFERPRRGRLVARPAIGGGSARVIEFPSGGPGDPHRAAFGTGARPNFSGFTD